MMKIFIQTIAVAVAVVFQFIFSDACYSQAPNWMWGRSAGGTSFDQAFASATDASGYVYVVGFYTSTSITFGTFTLTDPNIVTDMFVAKYDPTGNTVWVNHAGSHIHLSDVTEATAVAVDGSGNVYVTGFFNDSAVTFGSTTLLNSDVNAQSQDIFIVKYSSAGVVKWAKKAGGNDGNESANSIAADASGNIFVTGNFSSTFSTFGTTVLTNAAYGYDDIFLAKYDSSGAFVWAKRAGGGDNDVANSVAVDSRGNALITGYFYSANITFGSTTLTNTDSTFKEIFVTKYDANGNVKWSKSATGSNDDEAKAIITDASGNSFVTGGFASDTIDFGIQLINTTISNYDDIFVVKYDSSGNLLWARQAGSNGTDEGFSIARDAAGNCYVTGIFDDSTLTFGSSTLQNASFGSTDIFVVKYDGSGNVLWAKDAGGTDSDSPVSITVDGFGGIYVTGYFFSTSLVFGSYTLTNAGVGDVFLARLGSNVGLNEGKKNLSLLIYPNPFSHSLTIQLPEQLSHQAQFTITDVLGKEVFEKAVFAEKKLFIDAEIFSKGIYFLVLDDGEKIYREKIVKE